MAHLGRREECLFERMKEPFLETGYRIGYTRADCLRSVFEWHNESMSIWTHAFAFFAWACIAAYTFTRLLPLRGNQKQLRVHRVLFSLIIVPNLVSMASSVRFHTFRSIDEETYARLATTDFQCIVGVLIGTQLPQLYYAFSDRPRLRAWYLRIAAVLATIGLVYTSLPTLTHPALRVLRTLVFCAVGSIAAVGTIHAAVLDWPPSKPGSKFWLHTRWVIVAYACALSAVAVYIPRFPERFFPEVFDNTLESHILMHLVLMASVFSFYYQYVVNFLAITGEAKKKKKSS